MFCLTNTGFVQCYSLGFRQVCCMLAFILLYSVIFCFTCFASPTLGLCSAFPFGSPQVYTLLVFFVLFSVLLLCVLCPTSSGLRRDFSPAPLEFARFIFCFVFSFKFVFCVLSLTNLIFHRFPQSWFIIFVAFVLYLVNLFGVFYFTLFTVVLFPRPLNDYVYVFLCIYLQFGTRVSPHGLQFSWFTPLSLCICALVFLVVFLFF